jgi:hypothetical protein
MRVVLSVAARHINCALLAGGGDCQLATNSGLVLPNPARAIPKLPVTSRQPWLLRLTAKLNVFV